MRVYEIITDMTLEESENIDIIFTEEDGEIIKSLDWDSEIFSWDLVEEGKFIPYVICQENVMDLISSMCHKYGFIFKPTDITEEFLLGVYKIPDLDFDQYRADNLTEDLVYKKVKKFGASSLDELDKYVLENC